METNSPPNDQYKNLHDQLQKLFGLVEEQYKHSSSTTTVSTVEKETLALCEALNASTFETKKWVESIVEFTQKDTNRLVYSIISDFVFRLDQRDRVTTNIKSAANFVLDKSHGEYSLAVRKMVVKIYDHINLAIRQKEMFDKNEADLNKDIQAIVENRIDQKSAELTKEMTTQLVSLIAIFTALSFIVFGGISSLDSIFQSLQSVMIKRNTVLPTLIVAVAWAFCLMNLLFGFMYFVLRITNLRSYENTDHKNIVQRYPAVFVCDIALLFLLALFGGMWFAELHGIGRAVFVEVIEHSTGSFWEAIFVFIALFAGIIIVVTVAYYKKPKGK